MASSFTSGTGCRRALLGLRPSTLPSGVRIIGRRSTAEAVSAAASVALCPSPFLSVSYRAQSTSHSRAAAMAKEANGAFCRCGITAAADGRGMDVTAGMMTKATGKYPPRWRSGTTMFSTWDAMWWSVTVPPSCGRGYAPPTVAVPGGSCRIIPPNSHFGVSGPRASYHTSSTTSMMMAPARFVRRRGRLGERITRAAAERAKEEAERDKEEREREREGANRSTKMVKVEAAATAPFSDVGLDPGDAGDLTGVGIVPAAANDSDSGGGGDGLDGDSDGGKLLWRRRRMEEAAAEASGKQLNAHGHKEVSVRKMLSILMPEIRTLTVALGAVGVSTFATMQFPNAIGSMIDILAAVHSATAVDVGGAAVGDGATDLGAAMGAAPAPAIAEVAATSSSGVGAPTAETTSEMRSIAMAMMGYFTVGSVATFVHSSLFDSAGQKIGAHLRRELFGTILYSDATFFDTNRAGELANRLSADVHEVAEHLVQNLASFLNNVVRSASAVFAMVLLSPGLTLYSSSVIPAVALCAAFYGRFIKRLSRRHLDALAEGTHFATERFAGIVAVMSFGQRAREVGRYGDIIERAYVLARRVALFQGAFLGTSYLVGNAALLGVLWLGAGFVFDGSMTAGQLASFCMYAGYLAEGVGEISESAAGFLRAQGSGARLFGLLDKGGDNEHWDELSSHEPNWVDDGSAFGIQGWKVVVKEVGASGELRTSLQPLPPAAIGPKPRPAAVAVAPTTAYANRGHSPDGGLPHSPSLAPLMLPQDYVGDIAFENVSFSYPIYPDSPVLRDISLSLKNDELLAVTGPSGCGKSSLISLLMRFYEPTGGCITMDGVDVRDLDVNWLRRQIGNVPQEPLLFNGSVLDNVRYGNPDADEAEVVDVCKAVGVHDFINALPEGYGTAVGERGTSLSGGQRQRLNIARALLTKPRILALDEATSALDYASERLVFRSLRHLVNDPSSSVTSALVLTHHLSVFSSCDHVAVMEGGRVAEKGPYDTLRYTRGGGIGGGSSDKNLLPPLGDMTGQVCKIRRNVCSTHMPWSSYHS